MATAATPPISPVSPPTEPSLPAPAAAPLTYQSLPATNCATLLLRYLELEGVRKVFGVPGGGLKTLLAALRREQDLFEYVVCRQESGAAYIADGWSRVTGSLGVVAVTSGPGATNALTGAMNADASGVPMLVVSGEVPQQYFGRGYLQSGTDSSLDVQAVFASAVDYSQTATNPANFQTMLEEALRHALSVPSRAAHLSLPDDVSASTTAPGVRFPMHPGNYRAVPRGVSAHDVGAAYEHLRRARRPLIFLGNGCRRALRGAALGQLTALVERLAIPVVTTPDAKAVFPESHPLSLRTIGLSYCEWPRRYMQPEGGQAYDCLLVIGSRLGQLATSTWDPTNLPDGPVLQIDAAQSSIGGVFPVALGIVSDAGEAIEELARLAERWPADPGLVAARQEFVASIKLAHSPFLEPDKRESAASPILPQALVRVLNEVLNDALPKGALVFLDAGNCVGWAIHYMALDPPNEIHSALDMGPMGFGVGAVIGARMAAPDRACVALVGDGAFLMHGAEVSTAARYGVGAIWVVLNDDDLAMVSQGMGKLEPVPDEPAAWRHYYDLGTPDVAAFARALGADAYDVAAPAEFEAALAQALAGAAAHRPQVIVAHIDRSEIPPYYQGQSGSSNTGTAPRDGD